MKKFDDYSIPVNIFENITELNSSLTAEMLEVEWPLPIPVPERFSQPTVDQGFKYFNDQATRNNYISEYRTLETVEEEESDWTILDNFDTSTCKFPQVIERQSITNTQAFRMSDAEFQKFNINQEITKFIETTNEDEIDHNFNDLDNDDEIFARAE